MKKSIIILIYLSCCLNQSIAQSPLDSLVYLKNNQNVYSLIVVKHDSIIYKKYFDTHADSELFNDQSLTKNIISLLIGIAIEQGYIKSVDEKLSVYFPQLNIDSNQQKRDVTIRQVMNQASGLYHENLKRLGQFLRVDNPSGYVLQQPMLSVPGKEWHYNNAANHLLSVVLTKATGMQTDMFARKVLFEPLGIKETDWKKMRDGYIDGSGLLSVRLRTEDLIKIGQLILNQGRYKQQQIVPETWVANILDPADNYKSYWGFPNSTYSLSFYHFTYENTQVTYGMGWGGQFLIMIPSFDTVIAINENTADKNAIRQSDAFINRIFPAIFKMIKN